LQFIKVSNTMQEEITGRDYDLYPSRRRSKSFELEQTPSNDSSQNKKQMFKSLRRKSKHSNEQGSMTPDTVSSGGYANTPITVSEHDRMKSLRESYPNRSKLSFDEAHEIPNTTNNNLSPKSSHDRQQQHQQQHQQQQQQQQKKSESINSNNYTGSQQLLRTTSSGDDKPPSLRVQKHNHQTNTKMVTMNGDIVLSSSYTSKSSGDTATVTSASSNSKTKAVRRKTERNARAASALDEKANDLFELGYFDKAMACYTKALKLKRRTFAHLLEESDNFDNDDDDDELILKDDNGNPADPDALVSMATSINNIGYLRQRSGDATPEETMAAYKKSLRIKRRILGNDSLSVGKTLNNIGSVHYLKRDFAKALSAYEEALQIMKANLGDKHPDIATVMSNIGDVYLAKGDKETSVKYYRLALAIRWEAFGEHSPRTVRLLEKISNLEIGDMQEMANQLANREDDNASECMAGSDYKPINEALRLLQEQVQKDMAQLDKMERDATIEALKDKIIIIKGMRDCWNGSGPELLDNDSASVQTAMSRLSSR